MSPLLDLQGGKTSTVATHYTVNELLGEGTHAEVYRAYHRLRHSEVALKMYRRADEGGHRCAEEESCTLIRLAKMNTGYFPQCWGSVKARIGNKTHKAVVLELGMYAGEDEGPQTISLQRILPSIEEAIERPARPDEEFWQLDRIQQWILALASAAHVLHQNQVIHRDLKPANIIVKRTAGSVQAIPMFLDFNCSTRQGLESSRGGTLLYLPPEVRSGRRLEPSQMDDLWAIALVSWQMLHGAEASPESESPHIPWLSSTPPVAMLQVLRKALSPDVSARFQSAQEFRDAFESALSPKISPKTVPPISAEEFGACRAVMDRCRSAIVETLAGKSEIVIPKDVADQVLTLFAWLAEGDTQSLDIVSDMVRLGPKALPVALEHGYRLRLDSESYRQVLAALTVLGKQERELAEKSITNYALSSNPVVRAMCRALCRVLELFPSSLLDQLAVDEGILLPEERVDLADLCILFSSEQDAILSLSKYMCREYILDRNRYHLLRGRIASRMGALPFSQRALLVVEDTTHHIWEELQEFEELAIEERGEVAKGLLQLMADAFSSMGDDGYTLLTQDRVPRESEGTPHLRIFQVFARRLQEKHAKTREWLEERYTENPSDPDIGYALKRTERKRTAETSEEIHAALHRYVLEESREDFNALRFSKNPEAVRYIGLFLENTVSPEVVRRALKLLEGFENRHRDSVVACVMQCWDALSQVDYRTSVGILRKYRIKDARIRDGALRFLHNELERSPHKNVVRDALDVLLESGE